jgi:aminopeptidase-like protein
MDTDAVIGNACHRLIAELYPICRSITGNGVRQTLKAIAGEIPLQISEIPSGTQVFDWTIPLEWNINDAYILGRDNKKAVDFNESNLHILNYSAPFKGKISLEELEKHIFTLPGQPDLIPYRTSYHQANWGFCMRHNDFLNLTEGEYEVFIDSSLTEGSLTYGEYLIPGKTNDEVLISCHICHPSLCNDNLSGVSVSTMLARHLSRSENRYSYRFLFIPATIGAIAWLHFNKENVNKIKHGLVATLLGDPGKFHYKMSRRGNAIIDKVAKNVLKNSGFDHEIREFMPYGYDERQYCSPGFNLPVGCLMRTPHGEFPEYHTSADDLDFVKPESLQQSYEVLLQIFDLIEDNRKYFNLNPYCEPQLGKRGLYQQISGEKESDKKDQQLALLWVLNQSDGGNDLIDISEKSGLPFKAVHKASVLLEQSGLLTEAKEVEGQKSEIETISPGRLGVIKGD